VVWTSSVPWLVLTVRSHRLSSCVWFWAADLVVVFFATILATAVFEAAALAAAAGGDLRGGDLGRRLAASVPSVN